MMEVSDYDALIWKFAWECYRKLPADFYTIEELHQEGREVFVKMRSRRLRTDGAKFSTVFSTALRNRYKNIIRSAYTKRRRHMFEYDREVQPDALFSEEVMDAEEMVALKEFLDYLRRYDEGLADFFLHGPSESMERYAKLRSDYFAKKKGKRKAHRNQIGLGCVEEFFRCRLKDLFESFNIGRIKSNKGI